MSFQNFVFENDNWRPEAHAITLSSLEYEALALDNLLAVLKGCPLPIRACLPKGKNPLFTHIDMRKSMQVLLDDWVMPPLFALLEAAGARNARDREIVKAWPAGMVSPQDYSKAVHSNYTTFKRHAADAGHFVESIEEVCFVAFQKPEISWSGVVNDVATYLIDGEYTTCFLAGFEAKWRSVAQLAAPIGAAPVRGLVPDAFRTMVHDAVANMHSGLCSPILALEHWQDPAIVQANWDAWLHSEKSTDFKYRRRYVGLKSSAGPS